MHVRSLYRLAFLQSFVESAEHSRLPDVPKISRKHFSEQSSVRTTSDSQTSWAHEGRVRLLQHLFRYFFCASSCIHMCAFEAGAWQNATQAGWRNRAGVWQSWHIPRSRMVPVIPRVDWRRSFRTYTKSLVGRRQSYVSQLVESDTRHIQPSRFAGLPRAQ